MESNAKENAKRGSAMARTNVLQEESNSIQQAKADVKSQQLEMSIMEKDISSLPDELAREYFLHKKKEIIMKMQERDRQAQEEKERKAQEDFERAQQELDADEEPSHNTESESMNF